jgi:hypothetical protein
MANVIMLTAISGKIVPISRRVMNMTTVCAGARPGSLRPGADTVTCFLCSLRVGLAGQPVRPMTA